jgi:hypothetical protein
MNMADEEKWLSEYLERIPAKLQPGRALVHNRVRPPANDAIPGLDGFKAWVLHPVATRPIPLDTLEACDCGWMPSLGPHYIFPGGPVEDAVPDLRVEDVLGESQPAPSTSESLIPSAKLFQCISDAITENLPNEAVIEAVQVAADQSTVTIWTSTPGAVIGQRGSVAQRINDSLRSSLGKQILILVAEVSAPPDDDLFGGVGEPREPTPEAPSDSIQIDLPPVGS